MAKKIVNVSYKVDDSELLKAKATITSIATETKKSEQAMTQLSQTTTKSGLVIAQTYEGQRLQMQQLRAQIDLTKQSDTARLSKLTADYNAVKDKVDAFNKALAESAKTGQNNISIFSSLQSTLVAIFSVAAVKQVVSYTLEMAKLSGTIEGVTNAFKKLPNSAALLASLQQATHGTVTDLQLMQKALQAQNFGIPLEKLSDLLQFATTRAQQTGISVDYLVDSIVTGLGRDSIKILDNLQINIGELKKRVAETGQTTKEVAITMIGESLQKMDKFVENSATKVDQLNVEWERLRAQIAKTITNDGTLSFFDDVIKGARIALMGVDAFKKEQANTEAAQIIASVNTEDQLKKEIDRRKQNIPLIEEEIKKTQAQISGLAIFDDAKERSARDEVVQLQGLLKERLLTIASLEEMAKTYTGKTGPAEVKEIGIIEELKGKIEFLNEEIDKATSTDKIGELHDKIADLQNQLKGAELITTIKPPDETKNDADIERKILQDARADIEKDAEESYQDSMRQLKVSGEQETQQKKDTLDLQNKQFKEAKDIEVAAEKKAADEKARLRQMEINTATQALDQILTATLIHRQDDTDSINAFYDAQIKAAGNNDAQKKALEDKRQKALDAERVRQQQADKDDAITKIEIDTAVGIAKTLAEYGFTPFGIAAAALLAASGLVQIATVRSVKTGTLKTRAFADGEVGIKGPGTSRSDSIPAMLSNGESVINAQATSQSRNLLEAINERKIDDRILRGLSTAGGAQATEFDSEGIIRAIQSNKVDYFQQGHTFYKREKVSDSFARTVRAKVFGK